MASTSATGDRATVTGPPPAPGAARPERPRPAGTAGHVQRLDVQGLRAIAVVSVVLEHLMGRPSGGFVGVDIFFVISGYLITGLLLREHDRTGRISFRGFYVRRVKRIMPAATLTLLATVVAASFLLPRTRFVSTVGDAVWALFFAGNWRFVQQSTDYFQQGLLPSPLQHFWSLGVEEQYYLVWPWLMLGLLTVIYRRNGSRRHGRLTLAVTIGAVVVASFAWALLQTGSAPTTAYFSTLTRVWELGIGALVAIVFARPAGPPVVRAVLAWVGLVLVVVSLFVVTTTGFPAPGAALPVLATALVLATGGPSARLWPLTNPVSRYLGDISYSLYLWHFPVVVLLAAVMASGTWRYYAVAFVLMLALSTASYHFVENPVRRSAWLTGRPVPRTWRRTLAVVLVTVVPVAGAGVVAVNLRADAQPQTVAEPLDDCFGAEAAAPGARCEPPQDRAVTPSVDVAAQDAKGAFVCWIQQDAPMRSCTFGSKAPDATRVALVGDSHAAMLLPALRPMLDELNWSLDTYTGYNCAWRDGGPTGACPALPDINERLAGGDAPYDIVLTTAARQFQTADQAPAVRRAWEAVAARGTKIVVVADNPLVPEATLECMQRVTTDPRECSTPRTEALGKADLQAQLAGTVPGVSVADLTPFYCDTRSCPLVIGNVVVYRDTYGHITATWSRTLGPYLTRAVTAAVG